MNFRKPVTFENTLVALFDIQAYSSFVGSSPKDEVVSRTEKLFSFARSAGTTNFGSAKTRFWVMSDTVVIAIDTNHAPLHFGSAYLFLHSCSDLLHSSIRFCELPLRGAIGFGYLYFDEDLKKDEYGDGSIILGDALVDAAKHEKMQNWLGARLTPNAVNALEGFISDTDGKKILDSEKLNGVCEYGSIPLKDGKTDQGYYILPFDKNPHWRNSLPSYFVNKEGKLDNTERLWT